MLGWETGFESDISAGKNVVYETGVVERVGTGAGCAAVVSWREFGTGVCDSRRRWRLYVSLRGCRREMLNDADMIIDATRLWSRVGFFCVVECGRSWRYEVTHREKPVRFKPFPFASRLIGPTRLRSSRWTRNVFIPWSKFFLFSLCSADTNTAHVATYVSYPTCARVF